MKIAFLALNLLVLGFVAFPVHGDSHTIYDQIMRKPGTQEDIQQKEKKKNEAFELARRTLDERLFSCKTIPSFITGFTVPEIPGDQGFAPMLPIPAGEHYVEMTFRKEYGEEFAMYPGRVSEAERENDGIVARWTFLLSTQLVRYYDPSRILGIKSNEDGWSDWLKPRNGVFFEIIVVQKGDEVFIESDTATLGTTRHVKWFQPQSCTPVSHAYGKLLGTWLLEQEIAGLSWEDWDITLDNDQLHIAVRSSGHSGNRTPLKISNVKFNGTVLSFSSTREDMPHRTSNYEFELIRPGLMQGVVTHNYTQSQSGKRAYVEPYEIPPPPVPANGHVTLSKKRAAGPAGPDDAAPQQPVCGPDEYWHPGQRSCYKKSPSLDPYFKHPNRDW